MTTTTTATEPDILSLLDQRGRIADAMTKYGGGFVSGLALAFSRADTGNASRLIQAFPEIFQQFGPGSPFFEITPR